MIQPLNYCTHAIEDYQGYLSIPDEYWRSGNKTLIRETVKTLRKAEKFILPTNAELGISIGLTVASFELCKLPYPLIALEFPTTNWEGVNATILLIEEGGDGFIYMSPIPRSRTAPESEFQWFNPTYRCRMNPLECIAEIQKGDGYCCIGSIEFPFGGRGEYVPRDEEYRLLDRCARVVLGFCSLVNCANIGTDIVPAPLALNKKRALKQKEPFYSYRVLTIGPGKKGEGLSFSGHHASPRMHLRRGHIRHLEDKSVWVRHCIVGNPDKGVVEKAYAV